MVEVFKTNIRINVQAKRTIILLKQAFPTCQFNFDLEDCDKILRAETFNTPVNPADIIRVLADFGFQCEVLDDFIPALNLKEIVARPVIYGEELP